VGLRVEKGNTPGTFHQAIAIEAAPDGTVLILSRDIEVLRLQSFSSKLEFIAEAKPALVQKAAAGALDMAVAADGSVYILRQGGKVSRLDPKLRGFTELSLAQGALALEAGLGGELYALLEDGSGVVKLDAKGVQQAYLPLEARKDVRPRRLAVTPKGWVAVLLLGDGPSRILVLQPDGGTFEYLVPNLKNEVYDYMAAMNEERVLLNRVGDLSVMTVDLNARLVEKRCFDSDKKDLFKNPGFVAADKRSGLVFVQSSDGLVAGRLP
jgi:streptogramin lyase